MSKKIRYSEIFYSFQGEGAYTGKPTVWIRFFGCNLECSGFGQKEPTKPETYELPYKKLDITQIKSLDHMPVFDYGCDSSYSWASKFKHLAKTETVEKVCDKLIKLIPQNRFSPRFDVTSIQTPSQIHLAFTGGEPMLWQQSMIDIIDELIARGEYPRFVTVETNGTQNLSKELSNKIVYWSEELGIEWFWSVSPKLEHVSGEKDAVKPDIIAQYMYSSTAGQLKFVLNNSKEAWAELESYHFYTNWDIGCPTLWDTYIMPVGATTDSQTGSINKELAEIATKAINKGYCVSGRVHCQIFGNSLGT